MRKVLLILLILAVASPCLAKYSGGTGEPNTPYQIATAADMNDIGNHTEDFNKCFVMTADIDLSQYTGTQFKIIGPFTGVFDGNGHTVSNFTFISSDHDNVGLFGSTDGATIVNLGIINPVINAGQGEFIGALSGSSGCSWFYRFSKIENCYVKGGSISGYRFIGGLLGSVGGNHTVFRNCWTSSEVNGVWYVGGLAGSASQMDINNCNADSSVIGNNRVGGLLGNQTDCQIDRCFATGNITAIEVAITPNFHGGLVGYMAGGKISNSNASGIVTGIFEVGGLVGYMESSTFGEYIYRSYATGLVTGESDVGGLIGEQMEGQIVECFATGNVTGIGQLADYFGGLVGYSYNGLIRNCYASGTVFAKRMDGGGLIGGLSESDVCDCYSVGHVSGGLRIGGLAGEIVNDAFIYNSFWDINTSGQLTSAGGIGKTTAEMKMRNTFSNAGWDFNNVWHICETTNYPKLKWQILPGDIVCPDGVDFEDLAELCSQWLFEEIPADLAPQGGDGIVDFTDFAVFAGQWGITENIDELLDFTGQWLKRGLPVCSADISSDGQVNSTDFVLMANNWLQGF